MWTFVHTWHYDVKKRKATLKSRNRKAAIQVSKWKYEKWPHTFGCKATQSLTSLLADQNYLQKARDPRLIQQSPYLLPCVVNKYLTYQRNGVGRLSIWFDCPRNLKFFRRLSTSTSVALPTLQVPIKGKKTREMSKCKDYHDRLTYLKVKTVVVRRSHSNFPRSCFALSEWSLTNVWLVKTVYLNKNSSINYRTSQRHLKNWESKRKRDFASWLQRCLLSDDESESDHSTSTKSIRHFDFHDV